MDLRQIRYFCAVADAGSFSAGAKRAFVTQPTLSAAIAGLEAELGVTLFERRARGVTLTADGQAKIGHARAVLRETEMIRSAGHQATTAKPLRLGLLPSIPRAVVAEALTRLRIADPVQIWRTEDAGARLLEQRLANGRCDAVLTSLGRARPGYRQTVLAEDSQALAVATSDRPKGRITPRYLDGRPLIVRTHCEHLQAASRILDDWQVRPVVVARTDSDARALGMVAAGLGACLMPDSFRHDGVAFSRPRGVNLRRRLGIEWIGGAGDAPAALQRAFG